VLGLGTTSLNPDKVKMQQTSLYWVFERNRQLHWYWKKSSFTI